VISLRRLLIALLLTAAPALSAQHYESITVEVVDVPVYVERNGRPVTGLRREHFELFVDGKRQPVEYFDVIDEADASTVVPIRERRLFLLFFDLAFSHPGAIRRAQAAALELLSKAGEGDLFSVATFSARRGLDYVLPFTDDRHGTHDAIIGLGFSPARDPLGLIVSPPPSFMTAPEPQFPSDIFFNAPGKTDTIRTYEARQVEQEITELASVAERLALLKGTKHVIVLSPGFSAATVHDLGRNRGNRPPMASPRLIQLLDQMYQRYHSAGIFLHAVDTDGLRVAADALANDALHLLASGTGGRVIRHRNDLGAALVDLIHEQGTGYLLGFRPNASRRGYRKLAVKLKDVPGASVRYRRGFSNTPRVPDVTNGMYLADIILNDVPQSGVPARIDAMGGSLIIRLPLQDIAAQLGGPGKAEVLLYIVDNEGTVVDFYERTVEVPANAPKHGMLSVQLALPKGRYTAKALLRVGDSLGYSKLAFSR
jgi:VWFA-related protein